MEASSAASWIEVSWVVFLKAVKWAFGKVGERETLLGRLHSRTAAFVDMSTTCWVGSLILSIG